MVLTSAIGKFHFHDSAPLSTAKLIRDTVMGEKLANHNPQLRTSEDCLNWSHATFKTNSERYLRAVILTPVSEKVGAL